MINTKGELSVAIDYVLQMIQQEIRHATEMSKQQEDQQDFRFFDGKHQGLAIAFNLLKELKGKIE